MPFVGHGDLLNICGCKDVIFSSNIFSKINSRTISKKLVLYYVFMSNIVTNKVVYFRKFK